MSTPGEEVLEFIRNTPTTEGRELDVAIAYAALVLDELRANVADWEATVALLRQMKCRRVAETN